MAIVIVKNVLFKSIVRLIKSASKVNAKLSNAKRRLSVTLADIVLVEFVLENHALALTIVD